MMRISLKTAICCVAYLLQLSISGAQSKPINWSVTTANSFIEKFPNPDSICWSPKSNHFDWQAGYNMFVMEKLWRATGDVRYFNYIKRYVDQQVDDAGNIPDYKPTALDHFLPGYAIILMYEHTHLEKYKIAARKIFEGFKNYPRNSDGSFWHADWAKHQMWVDGVFMGQMFMARYGKVIGDSAAAFNEVTKQMKLIVAHCQKKNGLLLHAWDESKQASWADKSTGLASEVWSEGLGWYAVLIADIFDFLPKNNPDYQIILSHLQKLCAGLKNCQDPKTGMWCQVVDKPDKPDNWNETSGTGMFLYLIKKAIEKGYINRVEYEPVVAKAYTGIIKKARINAKSLVDIIDCSSIGVQNNYAAYVSQPKELNTFAGVTSFILGTFSVENSSMLLNDVMPKTSSDHPTPLAPETLPGKGLAQFDFFYAGEGKKQNMYIIRDGKIVWEYKDSISNGEISDAVMMSNGNILFAHQFGITLISQDKKVIWKMDAPKGTEIHTAQPIGKDHVVYIQNGDTAKLFVINIKTGKTVKEFQLPVKNSKGVHGQFRHARLTSAGTILVAHMDLGKVCEYDFNGKELFSLDAPGVWAAVPLKNNNILVCSNKGYVCEFNHKGDTVWNFSLRNIPDYKISNPQIAIRLSNGNTLINNWFNQWQGNPDPSNPPVQAIEVTPDKRVVWALRSWAEPFNLGPSTTIQPLDEKEISEDVRFGDIK
jgi:rhamnogalacturonyl hydrolase YesR